MDHTIPLLGMGWGHLQVMLPMSGNIVTVNVRNSGQDMGREGVASSKFMCHMANMFFLGSDLGYRPMDRKDTSSTWAVDGVQARSTKILPCMGVGGERLHGQCTHICKGLSTWEGQGKF